MIGILLLSHGPTAQGLLESSKLFFGEDIPNMEAINFNSDDVDAFDTEIDKAIRRLDDGSGVLVMCDVFGGTPANRCAYKLSCRVKVITGMNLTMVLDALGRRMNVRHISELDVKHIIDSGKKSIAYLNDFYKQ